MTSLTRHQDLPVILHNDKRGLLTVEDDRLDVLQLSRDGRPPKRLVSTPIRNFLLAKLTASSTTKAGSGQGQNQRLDLHTLVGKGDTLKLTKLHVLVEPINIPEAEEWCGNIMGLAYRGIKRNKKVLLLVNPVGGKGKGRSIVHDSVLPILQSAECQIDLRETTHRLHAEEITKSIELDYDVIATASGDGLVYEVLNGLASRSDAKKALKIPIAPIPTGSANAVCTNLFGVKDTFNIPLAALNIIKGQTIPIDLCSVLLLPSQTRRFCFLSTALGLMVDLDIGTEHLRWMGDSRFVYGFLRGIVSNKSIKVKIQLKVVEDDKISMARKARDRVKQRIARDDKVWGGGTDPLVNGVNGLNIKTSTTRDDGLRTPLPLSDGQVIDSTDGGDEGQGGEDGEYVPDHGPIPEAKPLEPDSTWVTIDSWGAVSKSTLKRSSIGSLRGRSANGLKGDWIDGEGVLYFYAGMMPWVARDLMQWPVSISGDGLIDVVVQSIVPRMMMANAITGAEKGEAYWLECQHYYKVSALVVENLDKEGQPIFTIDGESFPWDTFHVEVHPRIANLLSLNGDFYVSDFLRKHDEK
uniref:D-erythro-sphingosine kinase n=1 Tax=Kwoniella bestiolae CBS 10118 TaxID=1296100 RepID=A0A1B9G0M9_9TREE|nr:D-erythro-sphingosine kinase [Kwoniella bestiolae CBS 10118]OCF24571.1 D-erythro-sphingosine kinase [Kwoniella bestiolae CBS 10118]